MSQQQRGADFYDVILWMYSLWDMTKGAFSNHGVWGERDHPTRTESGMGDSMGAVWSLGCWCQDYMIPLARGA